MNKKTLDEVIAWLMDNPSNDSGKASYYLTKVRHDYFEVKP